MNRWLIVACDVIAGGAKPQHVGAGDGGSDTADSTLKGSAAAPTPSNLLLPPLVHRLPQKFLLLLARLAWQEDGSQGRARPSSRHDVTDALRPALTG